MCTSKPPIKSNAFHMTTSVEEDLLNKHKTNNESVLDVVSRIKYFMINPI